MNKNDGEYSVNSSGKGRQDLRKRLRDYDLRVIRLYEVLPKRGAVHVICHQLLRSGTSPDAHYREACRAKSGANFISKMEGALQELDESDYWLEFLVGAEFVPESKLKLLCDETQELIAIFVTMVVKTKARKVR